MAPARTARDCHAEHRGSFEETLDTFTEHVDEAGLNLVPGPAYFLEPRPDLDPAWREQRVRRRLEHELLLLLRAYVDERLPGPATGEVQGLVDRIAGRLRSPAEQHAQSWTNGTAAGRSRTHARRSGNEAGLYRR